MHGHCSMAQNEEWIRYITGAGYPGLDTGFMYVLYNILLIVEDYKSGST